MCGLAGLYLPDAAPALTPDLDAMGTVMAHRGPDGEGRHVSEDGRFHGVFVRLAIIDLETGDQPIVRDGGARVMMGNGEIYNYLRLRDRLASAGHDFETEGDMEVVLGLLADKGLDFVHDLNGMFSLAIYERDPGRLILARDRLGIKPLYWARTPGGGILFGSEIKALLASGLIEAGINEAAPSTYLSHGYVPAPDTLYAGIHKLPPGHMLIAEATGEVCIERYWRPVAAGAVPESMDAAAEHLTGLLSDSVAEHLQSDVPVGVLLSGGIDSGLITALAAGHASDPLNTFTVSFEGAPVDEAPLARMVAERYRTHHTELTVSADDVANYLPMLAWHCEEPLFDASLLPNYLIEKALSGSVTVALNGSGGDELFAGYGRYFPLPVERNYLGFPGWLRRGLIEPFAGMVSPMTAWRLARAGKFNDDRGGYLHDHLTQFPTPMRRVIGNTASEPTPVQRAAFAAFDGPADSAALAADLETYLPEDLLLLLDRSTMAVGVEGRVPFLDHRLVEAALAVPPEVRNPGARQKALERRMAEPYLPDEILNAPKQGFASPALHWFSAPALAVPAMRILKRPAALKRGCWTGPGIDTLFAAPDRHGFRIYALLMLELSIMIHVENLPLMAAPTGGLEDYADAA
ncbi:MAG: asparagine synthase (glutamine-hydrolyzing) [Alphaproteobacteria bacterium]